MSEHPSEKPDLTPWYDRHIWQIRFVRDIFWIAVGVFAVWFGYELRSIFTPVLIALAMAYLFHPLITHCHRRYQVPRPVTVSIILAVLILGGIGFAGWLVPKLIAQVGQLAQAAPKYAQTIADRYHIDLQDQIKSWAAEVGNSPGEFIMAKAKLMLVGTGHAYTVVTTVLGTGTYIVLTGVLIPVYFFFFAWKFGPFVDYFEQFIPVAERERTQDILVRMDKVVATFFRARVIIAFIMGVLFSIGWCLAGVPYWFLLGMGSGLLSLVPYASVIGWPVAVGLKWLSVTSGADAAGFELWAVIIWPSVVYIIVQMLEGWVLTPMIQGRSLEMSMVTIIIVVFVGGAVGGLYGLLLCIPVAACVRILFSELVLPRIRHWAATH